MPVPCLSGKVSKDGCNYGVVAEAPLQSGDTIFVERGYVGVDAMVNGQAYRFVNTHLEVRYPAPSPDARFIQAAQAYELLFTMAAFLPPIDEELLLVGDINSSPEDEPINTIYGLAVPPYMQFSSLFADTWNLRPGKPKGYTCCQADDLSNEKSMLYERIDVIFSLNPPARVKANVLNNNPEDKTPSGLWPSDHATVVGRLFFD